jgi:hypothetical protein
MRKNPNRRIALSVRQIRHRPDSGKQFLVEVADGKLEKAAGPLNLTDRPAPEEILGVLQEDFAPDPQALGALMDTPVPARADYELDERGRLLDVRQSAPAPIAVPPDRGPKEPGAAPPKDQPG